MIFLGYIVRLSLSELKTINNGRALGYMQEALVQSPELSVDTTLAWKFSPDFFSLLPCGLGTSQSTLTFV